MHTHYGCFVYDYCMKGRPKGRPPLIKIKLNNDSLVRVVSGPGRHSICDGQMLSELCSRPKLLRSGLKGQPLHALTKILCLLLCMYVVVKLPVT